MGLAADALYYAFHPSQLRSIIQWFVIDLHFARRASACRRPCSLA